MWDHQPKMTARAAAAPAAAVSNLGLNQMRSLLGYIWAREFFEDSGSASRGAHVFEAKHCAACHSAGANGAPKLPAADRSFTGPAMVAALWHHGPQMLDLMKSSNIVWPRFDGTQMADLIAFLNQKREKKP